MQVSATILMIGLSNSGKTTLLKSFTNKTEQIFPTAGFQIHYLTVGVRTVLVYDCSGQGHSRETWTFLYENCDSVVFVLDANDGERFSVAKQALNRFIEKNKSIKKKNLCIMLNKSDLSHRVSKEILYKGLEIQKIQKFVGKVYVKQTSAYTKDGIQECFDWVSKNMHPQ